MEFKQDLFIRSQENEKMKNVIKDRDNEIESLKETIKLLKNKGEVNKLNKELSEWKADHLDENTKLL